MKIQILEKLGIPRLRIKGISIFNLIGTWIVAYLMTNYIEFFKNRICCFQLYCLLIILAAFTHNLIGDYTPLVQNIKANWSWKVYVIIIGLHGITGYYIFAYLIYAITILLLLEPNTIKKNNDN